jgi:hypothetical protein
MLVFGVRHEAVDAVIVGRLADCRIKNRGFERVMDLELGAGARDHVSRLLAIAVQMFERPQQRFHFAVILHQQVESVDFLAYFLGHGIPLEMGRITPPDGRPAELRWERQRNETVKAQKKQAKPAACARSVV